MTTTTRPTPTPVTTGPPVPAEQVRRTPRRAWLATYAAVLALGAWAGAAGLAIGFLALPETAESRLPFGSPFLGGVALAVLVGVPATVLTVMAWRGHPWVLHAAVLDGVLLIGWIVVEAAFLRELSVLHAVYLAVGAGLVVWGRPAIPDLVQLASRAAGHVNQLAIWRPGVAYPLLAFAALGYAGDPATLPDDLRERELAPRQRKPQAQFVFRAHWPQA